MLFFELVNDRGGAHLSYPRCIPDTTAIERHVDNLLFDLRQMALISRVEDKRIVGAVRVLTAIALLTGLGGSTLDHSIALTMRAQHGNENHDILLVKKAISWHTSSQKSTSETLPERFYLALGLTSCLSMVRAVR